MISNLEFFSRHNLILGHCGLFDMQILEFTSHLYHDLDKKFVINDNFIHP